jgi:hypothetical protein
MTPAVSPSDAQAPMRLLIPLLIMAVVGMGWSILSMGSMRQDVQTLEQKLEAERLTHARELIDARLVEAEALVEAQDNERALTVLNTLVHRFQELGLPDMAPAYRLRAKVRRAKGDPGAEEDEVKATRLGGAAGS